jgi:hypothetical protein
VTIGLLAATVLIVPDLAMAQRAAPAATNTVIDIGGRKVNLVIGPGDCALQRSNAKDGLIYRQMDTILAGQNDMLLQTTKCTTLEAWRAGTRDSFGEYTQAQTLLASKGQDLSGKEAAVIEQVCQATKQAQGTDVITKIDQDIASRLKGAATGITPDPMILLGVLGQDSNGCYTGMIITGKRADGKPLRKLCIFATTILNGRLVYLYHYSDDIEATTGTKMLEAVKASAKAHVVANGGSGQKL